MVFRPVQICDGMRMRGHNSAHIFGASRDGLVSGYITNKMAASSVGRRMTFCLTFDIGTPAAIGVDCATIKPYKLIDDQFVASAEGVLAYGEYLSLLSRSSVFYVPRHVENTKIRPEIKVYHNSRQKYYEVIYGGRSYVNLNITFTRL